MTMMATARINAQGWVLIIAAIGVSIIAPTVQTIITVTSQRNTAIKVEAVKEALETTTTTTEATLTEISETGEKTNELVNSSFLAQLKISALALKRLADLTKHPDDIAAADLAEKLFREHEEKQKEIDRRKPLSRLPEMEGA